jgi:hypothetical protein
MSTLLLHAVLLAIVAGPGEGGGLGPRFVESRIELGSDKFEYQFADTDGDGLTDLIVTSAPESERGTRTLRLYRLRADASFPVQPDFHMTVPPDVVAFSLLDLRPEPGKELVLLTRSGIFALTTTQENLQGNLRREFALPLFPDLPDPNQLPCWRMIEDVDGDGREELLVVSDGKLVALATTPSAVGGAPPVTAPGAPSLHILFSIPCTRSDGSARNTKVALGSAGVTVQSRSGLSSLFPGARSSRPTFAGENLLSRDVSFEVPALFDWNDDGRRDEVSLDVDAVRVRLQDAPGHFEERARVIKLPQVLQAAEVDRAGRRRHGRLKLLDVDGDGRSELVLTRSDGRGSGSDHVFIVLRRGVDGTPEEAPSALVKLAGMDVDYTTVDVDHDGRLDLIATRVDVPTGLTSLANIRLDTGTYVFHGEPGATFDRDAMVKLERTFRPEQLTRVKETLVTNFGGDFDGDGLNDLVLTQIDGRVEIRRLKRSDGIFSLETRPLASFTPPAPVDLLETWDLSRDGVADLVLRHKHSFTMFVSVPASRPEGGK